LFCPCCSAKALEIIYFGSLMLYIPVQATLAMAWGPHFIGLFIALLLGLWAFIGLARAGSIHCRYPVSCLIKVVWIIVLIVLVFFSVSFFCIYIVTSWQQPLEAGFPFNCTKPNACVRLVWNNSQNHHSENLTIPIFYNKSVDVVMNIIMDWFETEVFETNRIIALNTNYVHARFITIFFWIY